MLDSLTYSIAQPTREWEWEDATQTHLISLDGEYEITQDPAYGYWSLSHLEHGYIAQDLVLHKLIMLAEPKENKP